MRIGNAKGLTLPEVLGTLTILSVVMGVLLFVMNQSQSSVARVTTRETVIDESRTVMSQIVKSARTGLRYETSGTSEGYALSLGSDDGQYVHYTFNPTNHEVSMDAMLLKDGSLAHEQATLSANVSDLTIIPSENDTRLTVQLEMNVPGGTPYETSTVVYLLNKN